MKLLEISLPLENGQRGYPEPYPEVRIETFSVPYAPGYYYSQKVTMSAQSGTWLETWAHWDKSGSTIDEIPIERYICDAVVIQVPRQAGQCILLDEVKAFLRQENERINEGDAVLVATGWDSHWGRDDYFEDPPYLAADCLEWILWQNPSIIGSDSSRFFPADWDSWQVMEFSRRFLEGSTSMYLGFPVNLTKVPVARARLYAFPLKLVGAMGSPVRAVLSFDDG